MTFKQMLDKGLKTWKDIYGFIDAWHDSASDQSVYEYLGITQQEYFRWVENPHLYR